MRVPDGPKMSALIVEDDPGLGELGAMMLAEFDLEVDRVDTAEAAIERLRDRGGLITVLLADIHLAGPMNGIALAHRVSILWPAISLIVTSGDADIPLDDLPAGAVFVPKPWRALDIVQVAERAARADHSLQSVRL